MGIENSPSGTGAKSLRRSLLALTCAVSVGSLLFWWMVASGLGGQGDRVGWYLALAASWAMGVMSPYRAWRWEAALILPWLVLQIVGGIFYKGNMWSIGVPLVFGFGVINAVFWALRGGIGWDKKAAKTASMSVIGGLAGLWLGFKMLSPADHDALANCPFVGLIIGLIADRSLAVGMSVVGGIAGCWLGSYLEKGDAILPVAAFCGSIFGLVAGPSFLAAAGYWRNETGRRASLGLLTVFIAWTVSIGIVFLSVFLGETVPNRFGAPSIGNNWSGRDLCENGLLASYVGGLLVGTATPFIRQWKIGIGVGVMVHAVLFLWVAITSHTSIAATMWVCATGLIAGGTAGLGGVAVNRLRMKVRK